MYILTFMIQSIVVVVDESLLETVDVTAGLKEDGAIIVNTARTERRDYSTSERIRRKTLHD